MRSTLALLVALALLGCGQGPLEVAGSDSAGTSIANGIDPQIDPALLPPGAADRGIYLYWLFDSDSVTLGIDASGHQRNAQFANAPSLSDPAPTARKGNDRGLFFNGTGQTASYSGDVALTAISIGLWLKPACSGACRVLSFASTSGEPGFTLDVGSTGSFALNSGAAPEADGMTSVVNDRWYYVAVVVDAAGSALLFVNGKQDATTMGVSLPGAGAQLLLGAGSGATPGGFRGVLDEAIVYDWAVPEAAMAQLAAPASQ